MKLSLTIQQLQQNFGGTLKHGDLAFSSVTTDTRKVTKGSLFVALKGERFDGHDFIFKAIEQGCSGLVVQQDTVDSLDLVKLGAIPTWLVNNTTEALGKIAQQHRQASSATFFAITGSSGKTTVKGMLRSICEAASGKEKVLATQGNLNNHFGVPFTLFEALPEHHYAVIEMGASALGEIEYLTHLTIPDIALVNNVMPAHLEGFGSIDNIAKAKGEIYEGLGDKGIAVINLDDHYATQWMLQNSQRKILAFSTRENPGANICARDQYKNRTNCYGFTLTLNDNSGTRGETRLDVELGVMGQHNVSNALAAAAMAFAADIDKKYIKQGLEQFPGEAGRLQLCTLDDGHSLIDDTYNANPGSVRAAVDILSVVNTKKILVLGDMAELGESAARQHEETGAYAKQKGVDHLLAIGAYSGNLGSGFGKGADEAQDIEQLIGKLTSLLSEPSTVLVKGSRSSKMENLVHHLKNKGKKNVASAR